MCSSDLLAELEAEERVTEALKDGPLNFPTFFARLGDSNAVGAAADRLEKAGKVVIERSCNGTISGLRLATSEALANSATVEEARTAGVYVDVSDSPLEEVRALLSRVADLEGDCGMLQEDLEEANKELAAQKARNDALEKQLRSGVRVCLVGTRYNNATQTTFLEINTRNICLPTGGVIYIACDEGSST